MKSGTTDHPKFKRLERTLKLPPYAAAGILELLWQFTKKFTPAGNIGYYTDDEISQAIGWKNKKISLIEALIEANFIEQHDKFRLIIHDWPDHCDDSVHMSLARQRKFFANGSAPKLARLMRDERDSLKSFYSNHSGDSENGECAHTVRRPVSGDAHAVRRAVDGPALRAHLVPSHTIPSHTIPAVRTKRAPRSKAPDKILNPDIGPDSQPEPGPIPDSPAGWIDARDLLKGMVDEESFATWIMPAACLRFDPPRRVTLAVPSAFFRNWVLNNFRETICEATGCEQLQVKIDERLSEESLSEPNPAVPVLAPPAQTEEVPAFEDYGD